MLAPFLRVAPHWASLFIQVVEMIRMDETTQALVKAAGLTGTAAHFPADIADALASLAKHKAALPRNSDPTLEPTPAYHAPVAK